MISAPKYIVEYLQSGKPLVCGLDENPYLCEFWAADELEQFNREYQVCEYAPGFFGFATSGGGEMFAVSPSGAIVCLPFIGMEPAAAMPIAANWQVFEAGLRSAL
jgi:hypothetical protein